MPLLSWLRPSRPASSASDRRARRRAARRPAVERLEDRTAPSATLVTDINTWTRSAFPDGVQPGFRTIDGTTYFAADDGVHGTELWKTDGAAHTALVKDINPGVVSRFNSLS